MYDYVKCLAQSMQGDKQPRVEQMETMFKRGKCLIYSANGNGWELH